MTSSRLLTEGGLAGHMSHMHEDPDLTFSTIKQVFKSAAQGELEGTEKLDGQNIFISYSAMSGEARAVRNKGQIRAGGLDAQGLARQFAGRGSVESAFNDAFKSFENVVSSFPEEMIVDIFGEDANIFYNCEIMDPRNANVVLYSTSALVIHEVGHAHIDKQTGVISSADVSDKVGTLRQALAQNSESVNKQTFKVQLNAVTKLKAMADGQHLENVYKAIDDELSMVGLGEGSTIGEYLAKKIIQPVEAALGDLPVATKSLVIKRIIGLPGISMADIKRGLSAEHKALLAAFLPPGRAGQKKIGMIKKQAIGPIEIIIHEFVVKALEGMESVFILDNNEEAARLRSVVGQAIDTIKSELVKQHYPQAMDVLNMQLAKLGAAGVENVKTASEGFVFSIDDKVYKFTGNFAPVNQILGMFKYGRGNVAPIAKLTQTVDDMLSGTRKDVHYMAAVGFKPPHRGHIEMVKKVVDKARSDGANVTIFTGRSARDNISLTQSLQMIKMLMGDQGIEMGEGVGEVNIVPAASSNPSGKKYGDTAQNRKKGIVGQTVYTSSPMQPLINSMADLPEGSVVFIFSSTDDPGRGVAMRNSVQAGRPDIEVFDYTVDITPAVVGSGKLSATDMRKAIADNDYELFKQYLPDESQDKAAQIWDEILNKPLPSQIAEGKKKGVGSNDNDILVSLISERLKVVIKGLLLGEESLEEISTARRTGEDGPAWITGKEGENSLWDRVRGWLGPDDKDSKETKHTKEQELGSRLDSVERGLERAQKSYRAGPDDPKAREYLAKWRSGAAKRAADASAAADAAEKAKADEFAAFMKAAEEAAKAEEDAIATTIREKALARLKFKWYASKGVKDISSLPPEEYRKLEKQRHKEQRVKIQRAKRRANAPKRAYKPVTKDPLEEISAMGAGSVSGPMGNSVADDDT